MLVITDPSDVIPRCRLVAKETLLHVRVLLAGHSHRDHVEMAHVMAGWSLMTLRARLRSRGGVPKFGDSPLVRRVTLGAVSPKQTEMSIFRLVAGGAVERSFISLKLCSRKSDAVRMLQPAFDLHRLSAYALGRFFHLSQADARERGMIHLGWPRGPSAMFEVTRRAALNICMKRGRLPLKKRLIVGMADDAFVRLHSLHRRVAGSAIVFERCMRLRKVAGANHVLPENRRENRARCFLAMTS